MKYSPFHLSTNGSASSWSTWLGSPMTGLVYGASAAAFVAVVHTKNKQSENRRAALIGSVQSCTDRAVTLMLSPHPHLRPQQKQESEVRGRWPFHRNWPHGAGTPRRLACPPS